MLTAKEALQRAIAAAEVAQVEAAKAPYANADDYAQLAQAWAAIARELRRDYSTGEWPYYDEADEDEDRLDGVPLAMQVTGEGGDGGPTLEWALDRIADLSDQLTRWREGGDGGDHHGT